MIQLLPRCCQPWGARAEDSAGLNDTFSHDATRFRSPAGRGAMRSWRRDLNLTCGRLCRSLSAQLRGFPRDSKDPGPTARPSPTVALVMTTLSLAIFAILRAPLSRGSSRWIARDEQAHQRVLFTHCRSTRDGSAGFHCGLRSLSMIWARTPSIMSWLPRSATPTRSGSVQLADVVTDLTAEANR